MRLAAYFPGPMWPRALAQATLMTVSLRSMHILKSFAAFTLIYYLRKCIEKSMQFDTVANCYTFC
jgi:hypothetical protein